MKTMTKTSAARSSFVRLRILAILVMMSFIAYFLRTNLSFAGNRQ